MSINAPATITITGDVSLTITSTWSVNPAGSTFTVNSNTYAYLSIFDNPYPILKDIQVAGSCTASQTQFIFSFLKAFVEIYQLQALQTTNLRLSIAIA